MAPIRRSGSGADPARSNVDNYRDPYINQASLQDGTTCKECGSIYKDQRWYLKNHIDADWLKHHKVQFILCPACRKIHDRDPGGIVSLKGGFLERHKEDIMNLIHNESHRAMELNPLERIMSIDCVDSTCTVSTTNERLAQRLGKAIHKAYDGEVVYKWSEDNKLVRVTWTRETTNGGRK